MDDDGAVCETWGGTGSWMIEQCETWGGTGSWMVMGQCVRHGVAQDHG